MIRAAQARAPRIPCTNRYSVLANDVHETGSESEHFHIPITISGVQRSKEVAAMVDSGASTLFINKQFVNENKVRTRRLKQPIPVYNIDGTLNRSGSIEEVAILNMKIGDHEERTIFTVTDIGPEDVIIGIDWLRYHNPTIDWYEGIITMNRCPDDCKPKDRTVQEETPRRVLSESKKKRPVRARKVEPAGLVDVSEEDEDENDESTDTETSKSFNFNKPEQLRANSSSLFTLAGYTYSSELAEAEIRKKLPKTFEEMVPEQYRQYAHIFSEQDSQRLPEHKSYDHAIELVPDAKAWHAKVYPLSQNEQVELDKFIQENLEKGYIRPSKSPMASPFFL